MDLLIEDFKKRLQPLINTFKKELASLRTSRPNPALVEDLPVVYYEQKLTVKQLGSISILPPREIDIHVWDKEALSSVVKAIETSGLGLSLNTESNLIKVHLPELSEERRKELIKKAKQIAEEHRIQIRHLRDDYNKQIQQNFEKHKITEDGKFKFKEEIQKEVAKVNEEIEKSLNSKIKEMEL